MAPKRPNSDEGSKIEGFDRTLFSPNPMQQEEESERAVTDYLRSHNYGRSLPRQDYIE